MGSRSDSAGLLKTRPRQGARPDWPQGLHQWDDVSACDEMEALRELSAREYAHIPTFNNSAIKLKYCNREQDVRGSCGHFPCRFAHDFFELAYFRRSRRCTSCPPGKPREDCEQWHEGQRHPRDLAIEHADRRARRLRLEEADVERKRHSASERVENDPRDLENGQPRGFADRERKIPPESPVFRAASRPPGPGPPGPEVQDDRSLGWRGSERQREEFTRGRHDDNPALRETPPMRSLHDQEPLRRPASMREPSPIFDSREPDPERRAEYFRRRAPPDEPPSMRLRPPLMEPERVGEVPPVGERVLHGDRLSLGKRTQNPNWIPSSEAEYGDERASVRRRVMGNEENEHLRERSPRGKVDGLFRSPQRDYVESRDRGKERGRGWEGARDEGRDVGRGRDGDRTRDRDRNVDWDRGRGRDGGRDFDRDGDRAWKRDGRGEWAGERDQDRDGGRYRGWDNYRDGCGDMDRDRDRDRGRDRDWDGDRRREREVDLDRDRGRDRGRDSEFDWDRDRDRDRARDREIDLERDRARDRDDRETGSARDRDRGGSWERDNGRDWDRLRDRDVAVRNAERRGPEQEADQRRESDRDRDRGADCSRDGPSKFGPPHDRERAWEGPRRSPGRDGPPWERVRESRFDGEDHGRSDSRRGPGRGDGESESWDATERQGRKRGDGQRGSPLWSSRRGSSADEWKTAQWERESRRELEHQPNGNRSLNGRDGDFQRAREVERSERRFLREDRGPAWDERLRTLEVNATNTDGKRERERRERVRIHEFEYHRVSEVERFNDSPLPVRTGGAEFETKGEHQVRTSTDSGRVGHAKGGPASPSQTGPHGYGRSDGHPGNTQTTPAEAVGDVDRRRQEDSKSRAAGADTGSEGAKGPDRAKLEVSPTKSKIKVESVARTGEDERKKSSPGQSDAGVSGPAEKGARPGAGVGNVSRSSEVGDKSAEAQAGDSAEAKHHVSQAADTSEEAMEDGELAETVPYSAAAESTGKRMNFESWKLLEHHCMSAGALDAVAFTMTKTLLLNELQGFQREDATVMCSVLERLVDKAGGEVGEVAFPISAAHLGEESFSLGIPPERIGDHEREALGRCFAAVQEQTTRCMRM